MIRNDIENKIIAFFTEQTGRWFLMKTPKITPNSDLNNDSRFLWEDAYEIINEYFTLFSVDQAKFDFINYFPDENSIVIPQFLLPKKYHINIEPKPLTVGMFIESAKTGRWLYD